MDNKSVDKIPVILDYEETEILYEIENGIVASAIDTTVDI